MSSDFPLLELKNLQIAFGEAMAPAVSNISFTLHQGETIGIVGESGSGKSITSLALMGLLPKSAIIQEGEAYLYSHNEKRNLFSLHEDELRSYRGNRLAMIFQEPMTSLNPVMTCGYQVAEALLQHKKLSNTEARERTIALFKEVELPRPEAIYSSYPHQLSGGQKQRVMIAMAMCCQPEVIIADEPTTALDVTVQKRILQLLNELKAKNNMGLIFISHDLGVIGEVADKVMVMYRGKVLEYGLVSEVLRNPQHNYTKALISCRPRLDVKPHRLPTVSDYIEGTTKSALKSTPEITAKSELISAKGIQVWYPSKRDWKGKPVAYVQAVNNVDITVYKGETLGLVGESGCGKSTLGRAILRLLPLHSGNVIFDKLDISSFGESQMRPLRKRMQLIFQDPYSSLNPRFTVEQALEEPLRVHMLVRNHKKALARINSILDRVGLPKGALNKYPHQFSGGQRQRICIARALMVEPEFIVCDESVSALDVSVQAQVLNLLNDLKDDFGLTYIFISHDLSVVKYMSDRMVVMRKGEIVEQGNVERIYTNPTDAYTRELIDAIPKMA
jgi:peptide/nickel transport system ATP-binding protein